MSHYALIYGQPRSTFTRHVYSPNRDCPQSCNHKTLLSHRLLLPRYIYDNRGIESESYYPYTARDGTCRASGYNVASLNGWVDIPSGDESSMMDAVGSWGPVAVAIDASKSSFQFYSSGVYYEPSCSTRYLDHGVLAVGYGDGYWLVKNSWGTSWGQAGYIYMTRNGSNQCGIATSASYPIV